jgi:hypothetical protein
MSPGPTGPPTMMNPSSTSWSMNAACRSQPSCSRMPRASSQAGPCDKMHRKYRTHETLGNMSDIAAFKAAVHPQSRTPIVLRAAGVLLTGRVVPVIGTVSFGYSARMVLGVDCSQRCCGAGRRRRRPSRSNTRMVSATTGWSGAARCPRDRRVLHISRDRTRCPRCPASRGTTRCSHRHAVVAHAPRRARPVVRIRRQVRPGALQPRARCRPARRDAADS